MFEVCLFGDNGKLEAVAYASSRQEAVAIVNARQPSGYSVTDEVTGGVIAVGSPEGGAL